MINTQTSDGKVVELTVRQSRLDERQSGGSRDSNSAKLHCAGWGCDGQRGREDCVKTSKNEKPGKRM